MTVITKRNASRSCGAYYSLHPTKVHRSPEVLYHSDQPSWSLSSGVCLPDFWLCVVVIWGFAASSDRS